MVRISDPNGQQNPKRRVTRRRVDVPQVDYHERALGLVGLDCWLCYFGAGPHEVIPHIMRTLAGKDCDEKLVEAISEAARKWVKARGSYRDADAGLIVQIARRDRKP